jgi:uncharacterized protein YkwD
MTGEQLGSRWLVMLLYLIGAAFSCVKAQTPDGTTTHTGVDFRSEVEQQTFFLVNQYRKSHDMTPFVWSDDIAKVARLNSKDMATGEVDFGHEGFSDRVAKLRTVMTGFRGAGENVLMTSELDDVAKTAGALWLHSPHHLENIRGDFNYSGMGVWQDKDGVIYFTQIFMKFAPLPVQAQAALDSGIITPFGMLAAPNTRARP